MNKRDFINAVRRNAGKQLRVEDLLITTDKGELRGKGMIEAKGNSFLIQVGLDGSEPPPESATGIYLRKDFWSIRGVIEDELEFITYDRPRNSGRTYNFGQPWRSTLEFSPNYIELVPAGINCMTSREFRQLQQQVNREANLAEAIDHTVDVEPDAGVSVTFHAVLRDFELLAHNGGTTTTNKNDYLGESTNSRSDTFAGTLIGWEYGLVERDGDLHVYLTSTPAYESTDDDQDRRHLHAFLQAVAFTHAQHAWPFTLEHRRNGKLLLDRIHLHGDVAASSHAPFTERLAFNNLTKNLAWNYERALDAAYAFFSSDSTLQRESETLLYLLREATSRCVPPRIRLLSVCSLLESLVRVIYEEAITPAKTFECEGFMKVKKEVCDELQAKGGEYHRRLLAILTHAEPVNFRMQFDEVTEHLRLKPENWWKGLFSLWRKCRNLASHRMTSDRNSEDTFREDVIAESRIAGAINCMILKLMNYSGWIRLSAYEDTYDQI